MRGPTRQKKEGKRESSGHSPGKYSEPGISVQYYMYIDLYGVPIFLAKVDRYLCLNTLAIWSSFEGI